MFEQTRKSIILLKTPSDCGEKKIWVFAFRLLSPIKEINAGFRFNKSKIFLENKFIS